MERLGSPASVQEFARMLYSTFRLADQKGFTSLVVRMPIGDGIAVAIRERLSKAAQVRHTQ
jgi:L-threonylcarbamoyladenylate synthase